MSMFPGAGAVVDYNDAGEPMGWDYPSDDAPDPDEFYNRFDDDDDNECEGHDSLSGPIGYTDYCDGSCVS